MLLSTFTLNDIGIMTVFDFIILVYGAYSVYTANRMKANDTPPAWLVAQKDIHRIRDPKGFCDKMRPKTFIFGVVCMVYGLYGLVESLYIQTDFAEAAGVTVFVVCMVWFIISLQNAKNEFLQ